MLVLSGHKLHAPKGVGLLYVRKGTPFRPFLIGGHQEHGRRAGTENTAGIIGLAKALDLAMANINEENTRVRVLRDRLESGLLATIPHSLVNGDTEHRLPNTSSIAFKFVEGEAILLMQGECLGQGLQVSRKASTRFRPCSMERCSASTRHSTWGFSS